jgi:subtilisin family serine protease
MAEKHKYFKLIFCPPLTLVFFLIVAATLTPVVVHAVFVEGTGQTGFVGYVKDSIVIKFDENFTKRLKATRFQRGRTGVLEIDKLAAQYGVRKIRQQFPGARKMFSRGRMVNLANWYKLHFNQAVNLEKVIDAFKKSNGVSDVQPIGIHEVHSPPNDPVFIDQWHLNQVDGVDVDALGAWDFETGNEEIIVAVPDTGVRYFHKDLGGSNASFNNPQGTDGNMWINQLEQSGTPGADDDNNGYVDDWIGWDFVSNASNCWSGEDCLNEDNDPRDFHGHGTHLSGIIAALNNNGYATASTAGGWGSGTQQAAGSGVKIMALRIGYSFMDEFGQERGAVRMDYAAEAFYYAADNGARLANASWGSSDTGGLGAAVDYFLANGGLLFKAAGNSNSASPDYLGQRDDVINVAATDRNDCKASFSNYGFWVDISAPGVKILSSGHNHLDPGVDYVVTGDGTSMASPLALSVAALIWSQNPSWNAEMVKHQLLYSADNVDGLACNSPYSGQLGVGRVNAYNAVGPCSGDLNNDGDADGEDLAEFLSLFESGLADAIDLAIFTYYFGRTNCP